MFDFPSDIERLCIETAILDLVWDCAGCPEGIPALLLTCKRFKTWCYPYVYCSIRVENRNKMPLLRRTLIESPILASMVRALTLPDGTSHADVVAIFPLCFNLTSLVYWQPRSYNEGIDPRNHKALRRLCCSFELFFPKPSDWQPAAFTQLTHLDLASYEERWYPALATLTNLSHLFVILVSHACNLPLLAKHLPANLRVCVLYIKQYWLDSQFSNIGPFVSGEADRRFVACSSHDTGLSPQFVRRTIDEIRLEWTTYLRRPSFWEEAQAIVDQRSLPGKVDSHALEDLQS